MQREPEEDQSQVVALTGGAGEDRDRAYPRHPAAGEAEKAAPQKVGREVLLADGDLAALPPVAHRPQDR